MSFSTLPINPSYESNFKYAAQVWENQFGDGYSQTAKKGINNVIASLDLSWKALVTADKATLHSFFFDLGGSTPFYYTPYGESTALLWKCASWGVQPVSKTVFKVTATLEQSFDLTS